jgi:hypothetical protein
VSDKHVVEVTLCTDCLFDIGHQCEKRWCTTWQAQAARKSRQVIRNMRATETWLRQQSIQAGLKR